MNSLHDKAFAFVFKKLSGFKINGAENGTRTRDPHLGKVVLYQLSYFRLYFKPHIWLESYFDDSFLHCLVFKEHPPTVASHKSASTYYSIPSVSSSTFSKIFHRPTGAEGDGGKAADFG